MPTDSENVCLSRKTGSERPSVRTTRLTHLGHRLNFTHRAFRGLARECELTETNMVCLFRCVDAVPSISREVLMHHSGFGDFDDRHDFDGSADSRPDL